ncbi:hypothetical protein [Acidocella sp.]|jgi:hypothetical protein|uniref:hypothetical protein n=1 Tax=Acidocella sp. TaxID=50710 RepID=UPI0017C39288|nr:hypothetical protein [Acidocella sp.]NNM56432.1 hypothetical protein [Acidocella sp.]
MGIIEDKLAQLKHQGFCEIERWEILTKFPGRERITDSIWSNLKEEYEERFGVGDRLMVLKCDETTTPQKYVLFNKGRASVIG